MSQAESQSLFQEMTSRLKSPVSDKFCNMYTGCQVSGIKGNQQIELDCKPQKEKSPAQKHVHHALQSKAAARLEHEALPFAANIFLFHGQIFLFATYLWCVFKPVHHCVSPLDVHFCE